MSKGGTLGVGYKSKGKVGELWAVCRKVQDGPSGEGSDGLLKFQREKVWESFGVCQRSTRGRGGTSGAVPFQSGLSLAEGHPNHPQSTPCTGWLIHQNGSLLKDLKKALKGLPNNRCKAFQRPIPGSLRKNNEETFSEAFQCSFRSREAETIHNHSWGPPEALGAS